MPRQPECDQPRLCALIAELSSALPSWSHQQISEVAPSILKNREKNMPRQPECDCEPCKRRRAANRRWHNRPDVKPRRLAASKIYKRQARANGSGCNIPDDELDRRALQNWPAEWGAR